MRRPEETPVDPEIVITLDAIDATLAGDPVDPRHAELAELALLLAADRPVIEEGFARLLDQQVRDRAAPVTRAARARAGATRAKQKSARRRGFNWWVWAPAGAVAASLVAAVAIVAGEGGRGPGVSGSVAAGVPSPLLKPASRALQGVQHRAGGGGMAALDQNLAGGQGPAASPSWQGASAQHSPPAPQAAYSTASSTAATAVTPRSPAVLAPYLQPPSQGRKLIQGAQLSLSTSPKRIDQVSQEVYDVVGQQNGIVKSSNVTSSGGRGGYAQFLLSVPSSNLSRTMADLSSLPYSHVTSRTDSTQDVTNQYRFDQQRLQDAQALRTSLLKQLASAYTTAQIDSLQGRIHDAEAQINSDEAALHSLQRGIGYSQVNLSISAGRLPVPVHHGGGFTLGKAAHDAGRVLTVAAGVALIVLAAMIPVGLLLALLWWIWRTARRRSRQQALDLA